MSSFLEQILVIALTLTGFFVPTLFYIWAVIFQVPVYFSKVGKYPFDKNYKDCREKKRDDLMGSSSTNVDGSHSNSKYLDPRFHQQQRHRVKRNKFSKHSHFNLNYNRHSTQIAHNLALIAVDGADVRSSRGYRQRIESGNPNSSRLWTSNSIITTDISKSNSSNLRNIGAPFFNTGVAAFSHGNTVADEAINSSARTSVSHLPMPQNVTHTNVIHVKSAQESFPGLSPFHFDSFQSTINNRPMTESSGISSLAGNLVSVGPGIQSSSKFMGHVHTERPGTSLFSGLDSFPCQPFPPPRKTIFNEAGASSSLPYAYSVASTTTSSITRLFHEAPLALLSFSDITYSTSSSADLFGRQNDFILKGVSGFMKAGTLTAIMGPSGCGKTTLLDILAGRKYTGYINGSIFVNSYPRNDATFKRISAYVQQDDALFSFLTVKEILMYTSELRLSSSISPEEKMAKVNKVMDDLDLLSIADRRIGDERCGGLSRGQRRRVTVAIELITSPSIIFLDEPTSGLDAYSSLKLMRLLKKLAYRGGRTIVCTIHQPRSDIFAMFDTIYMMVRGRVAYFGSTHGVVDYFKQIGSPIPANVNTADFIVDLTHENENLVSNQNKRLGSFVNTEYDPLVAGDALVSAELMDVENQVFRDDWVEKQFFKDKIRQAAPTEFSIAKSTLSPSPEESRKPYSISKKINTTPPGTQKRHSRSMRKTSDAILIRDKLLEKSLKWTFMDKWKSISSSISQFFGLSLKIQVIKKELDSSQHQYSRSTNSEKDVTKSSKRDIKLPPINNRFTGIVAADRKGYEKHPDMLETNESDQQQPKEISGEDDLSSKYSNSHLHFENERELESIIKGTHPSIIASRNESSLFLNELTVSYAISQTKQIALILQRSHINNMRNSGFFVSWIVGGVSFLFYGLIYLGLRTSNLVDQVKSGQIVPGDTLSLDYWDSQRAFIFQIVTAIVFLQLETLTSAHLEKRIFYREFASGAYSPFAYHAAWALRTFCYGLIRALIFPPLVYFMSGLSILFEKYVIFCIVFGIMDTTGSALSLLLVCAVPTLEASSSAFTSLTSFIATGCGFFLRPSLIPVWFSWAYYISWYKYALDALYINEFQDTRDPGTGLPVIQTIFEVDQKLSVWSNVIILFLYPVVFHSLSWLASWTFTRPRKNCQ